MHILMIPSSYPTEDTPNRSIFFKEQALAINNCDSVNVGIIYNETRRISRRVFGDIKKYHFQKESIREDGINTIRLKGWNLLTMRNSLGIRLWVNQSIYLFKEYIKKFGKPDLMHVQCALYGGMVAKKIKDLYGIPYVITEHASIILNNRLTDFQSNYIREVYDNSDLLVSVSKRLKASMENFTNKKVLVIPNLVDNSIFKYKSSSKDIFRFITVCNLKSDKNVDLVIRAFGALFKEELVELIIIGDGSEREKLEGLVEGLGLSEKVKLLGAKSREELPYYYNSSNAFVLASSYETFGVVYIEALASGLPIIATKCGGPEEFFKEEFGYLISKNNQDELVGAMKNLHDNISKFDGKKISIDVMNKFSKEIIAHRIIKEYREILGREK